MLFTTGQLRAAFGLSKQQWRGYREALPPLAKDQGRAACFSASDLLATSVVRQASGVLSVPLGVFTAVAPPMFDLLASCPWPQLERSELLIDFASAHVELIDHERRKNGVAVALIVGLEPLASKLRQQLIAETPDPQRSLAFPPMIAGTRR